MSSRRERPCREPLEEQWPGAERGIVDAARGLRVSFLVAVGDEAAGAGRFSERLGRRPIAPLERVRSWPGEGSAGAAGAQ
jgi:hypothetical protein